MNTMLDDSEMDALSNEDAAKVAILHTLKQIHNRPEVGWYLGAGTQVFSLLTKALAKLAGTDVEALRTQWACPNAKNPAEEKEAKKPGSSDDIEKLEALLAMMDGDDVIHYVDELSIPARMDLLQQLRHRFCADCGAVYIVRFGPCDCHQRRRNLRQTTQS